MKCTKVHSWGRLRDDAPRRVPPTHLVGAVDLGAVLQQQVHDGCVASPGCPDDGVNAVLLGDRRQAGGRQAAGKGREGGGRERGKEKIFRWTFTARIH